MSNATDKAYAAVREAATEWLLRLSAPDSSPADKAEFVAWLRASPIHIREYMQAEAACAVVKEMVRTDTTDVRALVRDLPTNVVEFDRATAPTVKPAKSSAFSWRIAAGALLMVGAAAIAVVVSSSWKASAYSTSVGEIRRITLPDGSTAELNTHSKIRIEFNDERRDIYLARGEAFFSVAKDATRPFRVISDTASIRALGTQFSVYRKSGQTVVTVVEGKVAASDAQNQAAADATPIVLIADHQVILESGDDAAAPTRVDAKRMTAWRQHRLIFEDEPLANVIAEFNRYNRQKLVLNDEELAAQGISGVFNPDKPEGLLLFLEKKSDVRAVAGADSTLILTR